MSLPWYPPELPRPERAGFQHEVGDTREWLRNDAGPEVPRNRLGMVGDRIAFSTVLTRAQRGRLDYFVKYDIKKASRPFLMPDPETHGWAMLLPDGAPALLPDGSPILLCATWVCLFRTLPAWVPVGNRFRGTFQLQVMP